MADIFVCDFLRSPIGRFDGALAGVRADDLAAYTPRATLLASMTAWPRCYWQLSAPSSIWRRYRLATMCVGVGQELRYCSSGFNTPSRALA